MRTAHRCGVNLGSQNEEALSGVRAGLAIRTRLGDLEEQPLPPPKARRKRRAPEDRGRIRRAK
jgi:hypothetical protein